MQVMRHFALFVTIGRSLAGSAVRCFAAPGIAAHRLAAGSFVVVRAAVPGLAALIAGTSAVLACAGAPAMATAGNAPGSTLASVIPSTAVPSSRVTVTVYCASTGATSATLFGRTLGLTRHIRMRANRGAGDFTVSVMLPGSIRPGTYHPSVDCSDGTSTTARMLVPAFSDQPGSTTSAGTWLAAGGLILIGAGAVTGGIARRRRKSAHPGGRGGPGGPDGPAPSGRGADYSDHTRLSDGSSMQF
jgi:hypothetical protein